MLRAVNNIGYQFKPIFMHEVRNIIVVGASAGGINAASRLLSTFKADFDAAVFIVMHLSRNSQAKVIISHLQKFTELKCRVAENELPIQNGTVYLAPADHHLLLDNPTMKVQKGAYENHWRPSIDVLFRSAAAAYSSCVTGIILTGLLDDGASGMSAIKRSGGICMVQDPDEAQFPGMPRSALSTVEADYMVSVDEMGHILADRFAASPPCIPKEAPADVLHEAAITKRMSTEITDIQDLGPITPLTCPNCGGVLTTVASDHIERYRCYTGHTFTAHALINEQIKAIEESLWVAIRMMEERKNLLKSLNGRDNPSPDDSKSERASALETHIDRLKDMLLKIGNPEEETKSVIRES